MAAWPGWDSQLLAALGDASSPGSVKFLDEWQRYEGGTATNNPLNTTQPWAGATNYNTSGVKNYPSRSVGITATAATLRNGNYPNILHALASGDPYLFADFAQTANDLALWGSTTFADAFYLETTGSPRLTPAQQQQALSVAPSGASPDRQIARAWNSLTRALAYTVPHHQAAVTVYAARIRKAVR